MASVSAARDVPARDRLSLIKHAERRRAAKRGGGNRVSLGEGMAFSGPPVFDLIALDRALDKLARLDPRQGRIVELRVFGGLTACEIAELLELSAVTVKREWRSAKAALHVELSGGSLR